MCLAIIRESKTATSSTWRDTKRRREVSSFCHSSSSYAQLHHVAVNRKKTGSYRRSDFIFQVIFLWIWWEGKVQFLIQGLTSYVEQDESSSRKQGHIGTTGDLKCCLQSFAVTVQQIHCVLLLTGCTDTDTDTVTLYDWVYFLYQVLGHMLSQFLLVGKVLFFQAFLNWESFVHLVFWLTIMYS